MYFLLGADVPLIVANVAKVCLECPNFEVCKLSMHEGDVK